MTKWEYRAVGIEASSVDQIQDALNQLGDKGWELVSIDLPRVSGTGLPVAVLKRPVLAF